LTAPRDTSMALRALSTCSERSVEVVARERQRALDRYVKDRDTARLGEAMTTLDRDQAAVETPKVSGPVPADAAVAFRADTPSRSLLIPVTNVPTSASSDAAPRFGRHQVVARAFSRPSRIRSRPYSKSSP
jgi:hypothetical protein